MTVVRRNSPRVAVEVADALAAIDSGGLGAEDPAVWTRRERWGCVAATLGACSRVSGGLTKRGSVELLGGR